MRSPTIIGASMEEEEVQINVVDVYDLASDIGKEFEIIIDKYGADALRSLMPRVICALEHLEKLTTIHESTTAQIEELRACVSQLENEKIGKIEKRHLYEKELEEIEDHLREESTELVGMVTRLQDENRKLANALAKAQGTPSHANGGAPAEIDMKVVTKLKEMVERQRDQLRTKENDVNEKVNQVESLMTQLDKVNCMNRELRRRQRIGSSQMRALIDERADLQAALQEEHRTSNMLKQRLGMAEKENQDLSLSSNDSVDLSNKLVYDKDDPLRPRFTMNELKEILYERNELKAKVSDLEDELNVYRPRQRNRQDSHIICPPLDVGQDIDTDGNSSPTSGPDTESLDDDSEDAVQGPLPFEPPDAPWNRANRKTETGIRKFFRRLFATEDTSPGGTPRRMLFKF